jgi:hypothetical protein
MNQEMAKTQGINVDRTVILERIDLIAQELSELRRMVDKVFAFGPSASLTSELLGCLGSEPVEAYDHSLDWERFSVNERPSR